MGLFDFFSKTYDSYEKQRRTLEECYQELESVAQRVAEIEKKAQKLWGWSFSGISLAKELNILCEQSQNVLRKVGETKRLIYQLFNTLKPTQKEENDFDRICNMIKDKADEIDQTSQRAEGSLSDNTWVNLKRTISSIANKIQEEMLEILAKIVFSVVRGALLGGFDFLPPGF
jgi:hypothetical protein